MPATLTPAQQTFANAMTEASLEALVADACKKLGLLRYHTHDSRRSPSGFPDDVILGRGGAIFRELKRQSGRVSKAQREWLDMLAETGMDVDVWRPVDWFSGRILSELRALSTRH